MAVEQQVSNGQQGMFNFIIAPVDMKQIFVMDKNDNKKKNATSAVKGQEVRSILTKNLRRNQRPVFAESSLLQQQKEIEKTLLYLEYYGYL